MFIIRNITPMLIDLQELNSNHAKKLKYEMLDHNLQNQLYCPRLTRLI
jgi:hypothetical protein